MKQYQKRLNASATPNVYGKPNSVGRSEYLKAHWPIRWVLYKILYCFCPLLLFFGTMPAIILIVIYTDCGEDCEKE